MLTLIRGLPGSGKSTLAQKLSNGFGPSSTIHLEADMYFLDDDGKYKFDHTKLSEAHQWCQDECRIYLKGGRDVIVSNTFVRCWEMFPYIMMVKEFNTPLQIIECQSTFQNIHNVPDETIERMRRAWEAFTL